VIVVDASVLIAYLDSDDDNHEAAETLLAGAIDDDFGVNTLTLAEVLVVPARDGRLQLVQLALRDLDVRELPFPRDTAVRLAQLRSSTGLKMPDCWSCWRQKTPGRRSRPSTIASPRQPRTAMCRSCGADAGDCRCYCGSNPQLKR